MSKKQTRITRRAVALKALKQGMAILKRGNEVHGLYPDGKTVLISASKRKDQVWLDAMQALKQQNINSDVKNTDVDNDTTRLHIYSDGGSRGNPGPSASGYVILTADESRILERGGEYLGITTNNQAEYQAVKSGLDAALKFNPTDITFFVDSLLVVNQLNGTFKVKSKELWPVHQMIKGLASQFDQVEFKHVYREKNTLADDEVNKILDAQADLQKS